MLKVLLAVGIVVGLGAVLYQTGAEISQSRIAGLEDEIARLSARERDLGERNARLEIELATARQEQAEWRTRYEADVPRGKSRDLLMLTGELLDQGVAAERIGMMIEAAGRKLSCTGEPRTRRFLVRTPIFRGANDAVTFADNAITVTASGASARDAAGKPEAWFDPAEPVSIRFVEIGGTSTEAKGLLPLHHTVLFDGAEYRFSVVADERRGFVNASADRCDFTARQAKAADSGQ